MAKQAERPRVLILGGGFAGLYTALELERALARDPSKLDAVLVHRENFFLFTPMLHEVAASDLDVTHIVNPVRKLLRRVTFFDGEVQSIDLIGKRVVVSHGGGGHVHELSFDHLVIALGAVTNFFGLPGLEANALTMKSLDDALELRNRLIENLEAADFECALGAREPLMSVVVAGGGFAGVETVGAVNDFLREAIRFYPHLSEELLRVVLVHSGDVVLPELSEKLGRYAQEQLARQGVELRLGARVKAATSESVTLSDGTVVPTRTLVWTAGNSSHPILATLPCPLEKGRVVVDETLRVSGHPGVWALGDCALVPDSRTGGVHPPTAQHALREGRTAARNILGSVEGRELRPFSFRTLGQLASIGRRRGVASLFGIPFSGFLAWWLWRTIYLSKLPRFERKVRVALDWALDLVFSKDLVQLKTARSRGVRGAEASSEPEVHLEEVS